MIQTRHPKKTPRATEKMMRDRLSMIDLERICGHSINAYVTVVVQTVNITSRDDTGLCHRHRDRSVMGSWRRYGILADVVL